MSEAAEGGSLGEEVPLDIACTLEDLKRLAAQMEVSIPVDETHLEAEKVFLDQTGHTKVKKKTKLKKEGGAGDMNSVVFADPLPQPPNTLSPATVVHKKVLCKLCNSKVAGGCEGVVSVHFISVHSILASKLVAVYNGCSQRLVRWSKSLPFNGFQDTLHVAALVIRLDVLLVAGVPLVGGVASRSDDGKAGDPDGSHGQPGGSVQVLLLG